MAEPRHQTADSHATLLQREVMRAGGLSRAELQRRTGLRSNTVIDVAERMVAAGWLRTAGEIEPGERPGRSRRGRPAVRLEVDPDRREVIGVALTPKRVEATRLNLMGQAAVEVESAAVDRESELAEVAADVLGRLRGERTLAVGISSTGLIDDGEMRLLLSSAAPHLPGLSLDPLLAAADGLPYALENDIHALGERWRLRHPEADGQTVLLIGIGDGRIGASLMPAGSPPDPGCGRGGNELGHMQIPGGDAAVPTCFCGQSRCLERAFSSLMVRRITGRGVRLKTAIGSALQEQGDDAADAGRWMLGQLSEAVANVVNFTRPHRVVWVGLERNGLLSASVTESLSESIARAVLPVLAQRVGFERWGLDDAAPIAAAPATAGCLALAMLTGQRDPTGGRLDLSPAGHAAAR